MVVRNIFVKKIIFRVTEGSSPQTKDQSLFLIITEGLGLPVAFVVLWGKIKHYLIFFVSSS